ncbi:MAG: hypothetical protein AB1847_17810 [bacterium]
MVKLLPFFGRRSEQAGINGAWIIGTGRDKQGVDKLIEWSSRKGGRAAQG